MQCKGNHTRDKEKENRQQLQISPEDRSPTRFLLVFTRKDTLDDVLIGTPIPKTNDGRANQGAKPRILRVAVVANEVCHRIAIVVDHRRAANTHHLVPTAKLLESQNQNNQGAEQEDRRLKYRSIEHRLHSPEYRIKSRDDNQANGRNPEEINSPQFLNAKNLLEDQAAGVNRNSHLCQHVAYQRYKGKNRARLGIIAPFQEFRHRINHAPRVERDENPAKDKNHPALNLPMSHGHAARSAGPG